MTEGIKQPNQGKIRTLREKEIHKYLGILEADTIKQVKKDNLKKIIPQEKEKTTQKPE